jgi:hypothetical protein
VSPQSRGRPPGRGRPKKRSQPGAVRSIQPADRVLQEARALVGERDRLIAEVRASTWLGRAWAAAGVTARDAEGALIRSVVGRSRSRPSAHGMAAAQALLLVAAPEDRPVLGELSGWLAADFPAPPFAAAPAPEPAQAWIGTDPWGSADLLLVEYAKPEPHSLLAHVMHPGGTVVIGLKVLGPGAADQWDELIDQRTVPMPLRSVPPAEVLAALSHALRSTDMTWPRQTDPDYVELRALGHARCSHAKLEFPDWQPISEEDRAALIDDFVATAEVSGDDVTRSVADLLVDYGDVELFLTDWLPRKTVLDAEQRRAIPDVTRAWVGFALARRGLDQRWVDQATAAVDEHAEAFAAAYDDQSAWGPAKQITLALQERGIDLTDKDAVELAVRQYNAEQLARRLRDE